MGTLASIVCRFAIYFNTGKYQRFAQMEGRESILPTIVSTHVRQTQTARNAISRKGAFDSQTPRTKERLQLVSVF